MNGKVCLDTNIVIRLFKNDPLVTNKLKSLSAIHLPAPVIAELLYTAKNSARQEENLKIYNEFIAACVVLNITRETADHYSSIRLKLKQKGRPISENDLWIASLCLQHDATLISGDAHFDNIDGLRKIKL